MKIWILFALTLHCLSASMGATPKIAVQNTILAKVNGKTISMIDVKKKMDMIFHQNYPQLIDSPQARVQFYEASWKNALTDLIDHELIISDALDKDIKLTDGDVRETLEERFGPNVMQTLDKLDLTYEEAWKMIKNEMIVTRMSWWFIHSKALSSVTPQDIRQAYRKYLEQNPPYSEWKYRVFSIRSTDLDEKVLKELHQALVTCNQDMQLIETTLKKFEEKGCLVSMSNELLSKTQDLSDAHKKALESLEIGSFSEPSLQTSRFDKKTICRIFYLLDKTDYSSPPFETLSHTLKAELTQQAIAQESEHYLNKLRKFYGFEKEQIIPIDFEPFSLQ